MEKTKNHTFPTLFVQGCILVAMALLLSLGNMDTEGKILIFPALMFIILGGFLSLYLRYSYVPWRAVSYSATGLSWCAYIVIVMTLAPCLDVCFGTDITDTDGVWVVTIASLYVMPFLSALLVMLVVVTMTIEGLVAWFASHRFFGISCAPERRKSGLIPLVTLSFQSTSE